MNVLLRILGYLRPHRSLTLTTLSFAALATVFDLLPPWLLKVIIDDVIQADQFFLLPWVLGGLVLAYAFKNVANSLRIRLNNILEQRVVFQLRQQVFHALQRPKRRARASRASPCSSSLPSSAAETGCGTTRPTRLSSTSAYA